MRVSGDHRAGDRARSLAVACAAFTICCGGSDASAPAPVPSQVDLSQAWQSASPAEVGMDAGLLEVGASRAAGIPRFRSLLVARHGRLVYERYFGDGGNETAFDVRSVTKSVVSALTGIAISEHVLPGIDVAITGYLEPTYHVQPTDTGITVRHLLTMTSGFEWDDDRDYNPWILSEDRVQYLLDRPQASVPGSAFTYDSAAVHVLGVVLQRASGIPLPQFADERLFRSLGAAGVAWEPLDRGTVNGGSGIALRGRDLLKLGQLYLQQASRGSAASYLRDGSTPPRSRSSPGATTTAPSAASPTACCGGFPTRRPPRTSRGATAASSYTSCRRAIWSWSPRQNGAV